MKVISVASATALAGLLSLVPAAYGDGYHECSYGKVFPMSEIRHKLEFGNFEDARDTDPTGPNDEEYFGMRFDMMPVPEVTYLIQIIYKAPYYRFYEETTSGWRPCPFLD
ncbi:CSEP0442 putative effector protein [Blumeria hordei DH14]|uniref:CSEP0442 putative effector protein n=1 Tax=Blumeria graminis f. sp. hordei (strain DH14) TaxID=546991 RepID=N1JG07_BLUG1|nr:CSEP0442 putative effector protein [Blumeria hordei DH14]